MTVPGAGAVVAWWDQGELSFAVVSGEDKQRVRLVLSGGREERVQPARIAFVVEPSGQAPGVTPEGRRAAGRRVESVADRVRARAAEVDVHVVWDLALESGPGTTLQTLTELALGAGDAEARAALVAAFLHDGMHFVRRGEQWEPRPPQAVEEIRDQRARTAHRASQRAGALAAFASATRGEVVVLGGGDEERAYLRALEDLAVRDAGASDASRSLAIEALAGSGLRFDRPDEGAFRLLRKLGLIAREDENLQVRRYALRTVFPAEVVEAARAAASRGFRREGRTDLTQLTMVTVDGPRTKEIDDGLSLETLPGGRVRLGVHIADPAAFVLPGDPVDTEAFARTLTHYLPDMRLTMLPDALSEGAASLLPGEDRPALSFLVTVDPGGEVVFTEALRSVVRSRARLDYDAADWTIESGEGPYQDLLSGLSETAATLEACRVGAGAVRILAHEVEVRVDPDGRVVLERQGPTAARRLVSEAMVVAGATAARLCIERGIPAIYRRQSPPLVLPDVFLGGVEDPVAVRAVRRSLRRGEVGLQPGPHFALGLPAYVQATSPLRRYQDLATHRQLVAALEGESPPYDPETLQRIAAATERAEHESRRAERASELYWILRWMESKVGEVVEGIVVEVDPQPIVQLVETLIEERLPSLAGVSLGERVHLRVERVNPRAERLVLTSL